MKKIISMLLTVSMLLSALPLSAFAENEIIDTEVVTETQEETIDESKIGTEVKIGNDLYSIQEDGLYVSKDFGRDTLMSSGKITWVIERDGALYWSKIEGYNADIYRLNLENGNETILTRVFAPATAFDVESDFVYYLYNGEISKVNVLTGEEVSMGMFDCDGFYLDKGNIKQIRKLLEVNENPIDENDVTLMSDLEKNVAKYDKVTFDPYKVSWYWPTDKVKITSEFAANRSGKLHQGIDIDGDGNEGKAKDERGGVNKIYATRDGVVVDNGKGKKDDNYGYYIMIYHGKDLNGKPISSTYMHMYKPSELSIGTEVKMGQNLGLVGNTGDSSGTHLHFHLLYSKTKCNFSPRTYDNIMENFINTNPQNISPFQFDPNHEFRFRDKNGINRLCNYGKLNYVFTTHKHAFNKSGKCECGEYDLGRSVIHNALETDFEQSFAKNPDEHLGVYKRKTKGSVDVYKYPNANSKYKIGKIYADKVDVIDVIRNSNWTMNFKLDKGMYVNRNEFLTLYERSEELKSSIKFNNPNSPTGTHKQGKGFGLRGTITSNYDLTTVTGAIINNATGKPVIETKDSSGKEYVIQSKKINNDLCFDRLSEGTYYLYYTAVDSRGGTGKWTGPLFSVGKAGIPPVIEEKNASAGKDLIISCDDTQAEIIYTVNGGSQKTVKAGEKAIINIRTAGSHTIKAHSRKNGSDSSQIERTYHVKKSVIPTIIDYIGTKLGLLDVNIEIEFGDNMAYAVISGEGKIHYTTDGSTPTENSPKYTSPIPLKNSCTVKAISIEYGCAPSDVVSKEIIIKEPEPPTVSLKDTKPKIAQGKTATVSWSPVQYATSYHAYLYYNGACVQEIKDIKGTTAAFKLTEVGDYTIKVKAKNFKGLSADSNGVVVSSMAPVWVTFTDRVDINVQDNIDRHVAEEAEKGNEIERQIIEGNTLLKQKVDYDEVPVRPAVPSKKGYTFAGWSKEAYEPALTDITVYAEYEINYYTVEFWNYWGGNSDVSKEYTKIIGNPQEIMYSESAVPPTEYYIPPDENYIFAGWSVDNKFSECFDYNFVEGNMRVNTAFTWANMDLPASVKIDSAKRKNNCEGYEVTLTFANNDLKNTEARVIVALYTSDNRMVHTQTIEMAMAEFKPGTTDTRKVDLTYKNKISKITAVMVRVTDDKTGGAVSKMVETKNITFPDNTGYYGAWSEWSDVKAPAKEGRQFDKERVVYCYRDKDYKETNYSNLSGWNHYKTTPSEGSWSGWSQTKVNASTTEALKREVQSRYIEPTYKTQYRYGRWTNGSKSTFCPDWLDRSKYGYDWWKEYTPWYDWQNFSWNWNSSKGRAYISYCSASGHRHEHVDFYDSDGANWYQRNSDGGTYYWEESRTVQTGGGYYEYRYKDTYYTYYHWRWKGWSNWSTTKPAEKGDREIQYKTQYRYRDYFANFEGYDPSNDNQTEEPTIKTYPFRGTLTGVAADYITEATKNSGNYNVVAGPYYKDDEGNYKLIADNMKTVEKNRYAYYTNGTYGMACKECAEELYGGEWNLEYTEWATDTPIITEDAYSCNNPEHGHMHNSRLEEGTYYWKGYEVNGNTYYHMETNVFDEEITYTDKTKYYLVDRDFNGKKATVLVYKKTNTDPTQEQLQYVDQIDIGANNSYEFIINPKDVLDYEETGDFIVTLSVEGCKLLNNIGVIKAPVPKYEVKFLDENAEPITHIDENGDVQEVFMINEGGGVDVNLIEAPEKEGHRFVKWDKSVVNIMKNTTVNPIYEPLEYAIVFVDHENETTELQTLTYGTPITAPNVEPVEGKVFKGWDKLIGVENALVTGSEVITAEWDTLKYTVQFCDLSGNILERETQEVAYGEAAELPDPIVDGGVVYPWDTTRDEWWNVIHDMTIYPYKYVANETNAPTADVATGDYDEYLLVNLETNDDAKIYYSTYFEITEEDAERYAMLQQQDDKSEIVSLINNENETPNEDGEISDNEAMDADTMLQEMISEFTEPIPITYSTVIYAFTVDEDGNISTISSFEYNINEYEPEEEKFVPADDVEQITMPSVVAKPGETVEVPLTLKNNPGVKNLSLILGYDAENLELVSVTNGEVFANSEFSKDTREDGSCKLEWLTTTENTNNGILATLTFKAKENSGEFNIGFDEVTSSDGEEEEYFAVVEGTITNVGENASLGDTNGDGEVNYADAILILRYDIGFVMLSDYQKSISDVNGDGEVDFADAIKVLRYDAGFINTLK